MCRFVIIFILGIVVSVSGFGCLIGVFFRFRVLGIGVFGGPIGVFGGPIGELRGIFGIILGKIRVIFVCVSIIIVFSCKISNTISTSNSPPSSNSSSYPISPYNSQ
jgi:hypothetical protein